MKLCWHFSKLFVATKHDWLWINTVFIPHLFGGEQNIQGTPGDFSVKTRAKAMGFLTSGHGQGLGLCSKALRRSAQGKAGVVDGWAYTNQEIGDILDYHPRYWGILFSSDQFFVF